jgi:DNA modification methylase
VTTSIKYKDRKHDALLGLQKAFKFTDVQMKAWLETAGLPGNPKAMLFAHEQRMLAAAARREGAHMVIDQASGAGWILYNGDCILVMPGMPRNSIHLTVTSIPFGQLYIYSDSAHDMGNSADDNEFMMQLEYMAEELFWVTVPGRLCVVHLKDLPTFKNRDGAMGLKDFPGEVIRAFESINTFDEDGNLHGWQFHSRVTIWKDPVIEMERTNSHGLLYKNFRTNAEACRQGMADYLVVFRKWDGDVSPEPVTQETWRDIGDYIGEEPPHEWEYREGKRMSQQYNHNLAVWQRYASPVWFDIQQTKVLNYEQAKDPSDEKHICPLQLDVIGRCIDLWSNPGDVVFDPFSGIGSTVVTALQMNRRGVGIELKPNYHRSAVKYAQAAEQKAAQPTLWDALEAVKREGAASESA